MTAVIAVFIDSGSNRHWKHKTWVHNAVFETIRKTTAGFSLQKYKFTNLNILREGSEKDMYARQLAADSQLHCVG